MSESLDPKPPKQPQSPAASASPKAADSKAESQPGSPTPPARRAPSVPMKIFVVLMALGIASTTVLGIVMAFRFHRSFKLLWGLLLAGTLLPVLLVLL